MTTVTAALTAADTTFECVQTYAVFQKNLDLVLLNSPVNQRMEINFCIQNLFKMRRCFDSVHHTRNMSLLYLVKCRFYAL